MTEYALIRPDDSLMRIQTNVDPTVQTKAGFRWLPVIREEGEAFEGVEKDKYVIRTPAPPPPEPVRRKIEKWLVMERLTDEQLEAAIGLMSVRQQEKWRMPGYPSVYADDPEVIGLVKAVGADPKKVLA